MNRAVQTQNMARGFIFRIWKEEGLHYLCSENKGADQLCGHRTDDLRLCFRIYAKSRFFHDAAPILLVFSKQLRHLSLVMRKLAVCIYAKKNKGADQLQLISAFVCATLIVQSSYFLSL